MADVPGKKYYNLVRAEGQTGSPSLPGSVEEPRPPVNPSPNAQRPPVHKEYSSTATMLANQSEQLQGYLYYDGTETYWYIGTTDASLDDYFPFVDASPPSDSDRVITTGTVVFNTATDVDLDGWVAFVDGAERIGGNQNLSPIEGTPTDYQRSDFAVIDNTSAIIWVAGEEDENQVIDPVIPTGTVLLARILRDPSGTNEITLTPEDLANYVSKTQTVTQTILSDLAIQKQAGTFRNSVYFDENGKIRKIRGDYHGVYSTLSSGSNWSKLVELNSTKNNQLKYKLRIEFDGVNQYSGWLFMFIELDGSGDMVSNALFTFGQLDPTMFKWVKISSDVYQLWVNHTTANDFFKWRPKFSYGSSDKFTYYHQQIVTTIPAGDQYGFSAFGGGGSVGAGPGLSIDGSGDIQLGDNNQVIVDFTDQDWLFNIGAIFQYQRDDVTFNVSENFLNLELNSDGGGIVMSDTDIVFGFSDGMDLSISDQTDHLEITSGNSSYLLFSGLRVKGDEATESDDFVTLDQLNNAVSNISIPAGAGLSIDDDDKIQLGNTGAGIIDVSDVNVFEEGFKVNYLLQDFDNNEQTTSFFQINGGQFGGNSTYINFVGGNPQNEYGGSFEIQSDSGGTNINISKIINGDYQGLDFNAGTDTILITDEINQIGLGDAADYSANKTDFSYVTKKMLTDFASISNFARYTDYFISVSTYANIPVTVGSNSFVSADLPDGSAFLFEVDTKDLMGSGGGGGGGFTHIFVRIFGFEYDIHVPYVSDSEIQISNYKFLIVAGGGTASTRSISTRLLQMSGSAYLDALFPQEYSVDGALSNTSTVDLSTPKTIEMKQTFVNSGATLIFARFYKI